MQVASRSGYRNETLGNYVKMKVFSPRGYHGVVDHRQRLWVLGGAHRKNWPNLAQDEDEQTCDGYECKLNEAFNDIWYTTTMTAGVNSAGEVAIEWTHVQTSGEIWDARYQHAVVSFQDRIWVIGGGTVREREGNTGSYETKLKNDLWRNEGIETFDQWVEVGKQNVCAGEVADGDIGCMPPRRGHAATVSPEGDKIIVFGGLTKKGSTFVFLNDVWQTNGDCATKMTCWQLVKGTNEWPGRYLHAGLVYQDSLWVLGGQNCGQEVDTCQGCLNATEDCIGDCKPRSGVSSTGFVADKALCNKLNDRPPRQLGDVSSPFLCM